MQRRRTERAFNLIMNVINCYDECDRLRYERDRLSYERDRLSYERDRLSYERDRLCCESTSDRK